MKCNELKKTDVIWIPRMPKHWDLIKVRHLFKEFSVKEYPDEPLLVASQKHGVVNKKVFGKRTMEATKDFHNLKLVEKGDFVISLRSFQGGIEISHQRGIISSAYTILKELKPINKRYFKHLFKSKPFISLMTLCVKGIRDGQNIDFPTFKNEYLPIPPLNEQKKIGDYLDHKTKKIQEFISKKERLIELLEEERREFIDQQLNDLSSYNTYIKPLKYLIKFISEQTKIIEEYENYLALENIEGWTGKIDLDIGAGEFDSSVKRFKNTDILFNKLRPYLAKVVIPEFDGVCSGELLVFRPKKEALKEFIFYKLISRRFIDLVDSSTFGSKMPRASWGFIGKIEIKYPSDKKIQSLIISRIRDKELQLKNLTEIFLSEIQIIKEYQESLITQVVTGQLKVPELTSKEAH